MNLKIRGGCFFFFFFAISFLVSAQQPFQVVWYNVENLFDIYDHPDTQDEEFTPNGNRYWTGKRYYHKLQQIAKVINSVGEWDTPALVGLCEVENDSVLIHLLNRTPLRNQQYRYCLGDTEDNRGIRTALLYQRDKFRLLGKSHIRVSKTGERKTRKLLHVWGEVITGDTLDVFVTHFPSRYGGEKESEGRRVYAAGILKSITDSIISARRNPYVLIMGDFNDTPHNRSLEKTLSACPVNGHITPLSKGTILSGQLYNLIPASGNKAVKGTHKYQGEWSQLDHLILNGTFLQTSSSFCLVEKSVRIVTLPFLLIPDKTGGGIRPKRTYNGFRYEGGYSDHLPNYCRLFVIFA